MGTGIAAVIPIIIEPRKETWDMEIGKKHFRPDFFENYTVDKTGCIYTVKHEFLLGNYLPFLTEFYDCIEEDCDIADLPIAGSYEEFVAVFDRNARNAEIPCMGRDWSFFSMLGGICREYWVFYRGSYKAVLEVYTTLTHFERILARAMKNPLAKAVRFGIYG